MILLFTLLEIIVVISIIAILVMALLKVIGNDKKTKALDRLKRKVTAIQLAGIATADDCRAALQY